MTNRWERREEKSKKIVLCDSSGIENGHEILSCAQLEAQQELSKIIETNAVGEAAKSETLLTNIKVTKRDNIVLGISDLKQKKVDVKATAGERKSVIKSVASETKEAVKRITISPINTIKVNNCEIVPIRSVPRSVTSSIFSLQPFARKVEETKITPEISSTKLKTTRAQSATAKIFRPNPQNVTSSIFAPRTKDMNKGFLMFSEDESGLTSKLLLSFQEKLTFAKNWSFACGWQSYDEKKKLRRWLRC